MLHSLSKILNFWSPQFSSSEPQLEQDLQQLIQNINPLLQHASGYPRRYRKALQGALGYVDQLAQQVPGPICLNQQNFGTEPLVRALFASPKELKETLRLSIAMKRFQPGESGPQTLYALMGVRWKRLLQYGVEEENGVIRRDVPQQTIDFRDHTFTLPASSEEAARQLLREHFLQRLGNQIREQISTLNEERDALYRRGKQCEHALRTAATPDPALELEIETIWEQWRNLNQRLDTDHAINHFEQVMGEPESALSLHPFELSIDSMGIERTAEQGGKHLSMVELHGADRRIWTIMLVQFQWQPPPSSEEQLQQAHRWLSIS